MSAYNGEKSGDEEKNKNIRKIRVLASYR